MHRPALKVASTLAIAALGVAGSQSAANASANTNTCTHGVALNNSGHPAVEYIGFTNQGGTHRHIYRHNTGFAQLDHFSLAPC